jgi:hypothetical protein
MSRSRANKTPATRDSSKPQSPGSPREPADAVAVPIDESRPARERVRSDGSAREAVRSELRAGGDPATPETSSAPMSRSRANKTPATRDSSQPQPPGSPLEPADAVAVPVADPQPQSQDPARGHVRPDAPPGKSPSSEARDGGDPATAETPRPAAQSASQAIDPPAAKSSSQPQAYGSPREPADAASAPIADPDPLEALVDLVEDFGDELLRTPREAPPSEARDGGDPVKPSRGKKQAASRSRKRSSARSPRKRRT